MPENNDMPIDLSTLVMDIRDVIFDSRDDKPQDAANDVCERVLQKAGAKVPAAYFQSAI